MPDMSATSSPAQPKPPTKPKAGPIVVLVVAVLAIIGWVNSGDDDPAPSSSGTSAAIGAAPEADAVPDAAEPEAVLPGAGSAEVAVVPDVVGMNHQLAQDTLQASGFYLLDEQDATGQGRMLIYDRNWEVVRQSVPAGSSVPVTETITLYSKKIGE